VTAIPSHFPPSSPSVKSTKNKEDILREPDVQITRKWSRWILPKGTPSTFSTRSSERSVRLHQLSLSINPRKPSANPGEERDSNLIPLPVFLSSSEINENKEDVSLPTKLFLQER
jgi:hypothetical protein